MSFQDFLLRARRPASLVAFNGALPSNFKLIVRVDGEWQERPGVNLDPINSLMLKDGSPPILSGDIHYNLRVTDVWSGWTGLFMDNGDPDFGDARLDKSKVRQWFKNNSVERTDTTTKHPRSKRTDMRWFRWSKTGPVEWMDITIDEPVFRRRVWL